MEYSKGTYSTRTKPNRHKPTAVLLAVLLLSATLLGVFAYYISQTQPVENQFQLAQVSCQAHEAYNGRDKSSITVENTSSVPVYIRVRLVSYWTTPSGHIAGRASETPELDASLLGSGWIADAVNDTYYYALPVAVNSSTPSLLAESKVIALKTDGDGYIQVVEVLAEAIQANPPDAVTDAWGVTLADNQITKP